MEPESPEFWRNLRRLLENARRVLNQDLETLRAKTAKARLEEFERIERDLDEYERNYSGKVSREVDIDARSKLLFAQLKIATTFYINGESSPILERFSQKEIEICRDLEESSFLDIYTVEDLREKIHSREGGLEALLRKYVEKHYDRIDEILEDPAIKLPIRYYIKKEFKSRIEKIRQAAIEYIKIARPTVLLGRGDIESIAALLKLCDSALESSRLSGNYEEFLARLTALNERLSERLRGNVSRDLTDFVESAKLYIRSEGRLPQHLIDRWTRLREALAMALIRG